MSKKEANEFLDSLKLNESPTNEEFYQAILSAYMDRTRQVYFIWKKIKELYPDIDANKHRSKRSYNGSNIKRWSNGI